MSPAQQAPGRQVFVSRTAFILAAIGSAIGLGNIWRFPYVAYDSGGGAFIIPYLIALLTAGIPLLFVVYAIGHRARSSAPLAYRSLHRAAEPIGWFKTGIATLIGIYYAVIVGWAVSYTGFSFTQAWGDDAEGFFMGEYLQQSGEAGLSGDFVPGVMIPLIIVWVVCLVILYAGVQSGIARFSKIFVPLLVVVFAIMVVRSLFLPGAAAGLDALFTPDWAALTDPSVWIAAYGQIFFSLSIMFGIMLTYASYLKRKTNLTGSGLVVGFANSSFEMLAGVGVFAALGFMAHTAGTGVDEVVSNGVGLAFIAFPTIISQMPGGAIFGVLFFLTLIFAGLTSLVSIIQVPIAAIADKTGISERTSTVIVGGLMAVVSILIMPTATGLSVLDTIDAFTNNIGIVGIALTAIIAVGWLLVGLPQLRDHLNGVSSFKVGRTWIVFVSVVTPIVLGFMLIQQIITYAQEGYEGYPTWHLLLFGWGLIAALAYVSFLVSIIPWPKKSLDRVDKARAEFEAEAEAGTATGTSTARTRTLTSGGEKA
ncbi:MAG: sodium-dependent transporter [Brevibacterium yomogidense]|uniref:sodium-dependent transporter n=1 Tax=Brevibacterium sp. Mu109 TaxID=1255669 RepID=UPI000C605ED7|nr:sodium-dependent transporter [Brevibacterium sp. Mu109]SMX72968.1 neurotransmitter:Na+ symporter, NSS family [Brevibacterium sp. Mu109]